METVAEVEGICRVAIWQLELLECPRRGLRRLRLGALAEARAEAARLACAATLTHLAQTGWPSDWVARVPGLVSRALMQQWRLGAYDANSYCHEVARLSDLLRRFRHSWLPASRAALLSDPSAHWEDRATGVAVAGRLDLLIPWDAGAAGPGVALDWRLDDEPTGLEQPPAGVVAVAALARARLGLQCSVEVRRLYLGSGRQETWRFGRAELALHWRRIRRLGQEVREDLWLPRPGRACEQCDVGECEARPKAMDVLPLSGWTRASA